MDFKGKRRCSFVVIAIFMFFDGIEYAVVFPTLWEYLQSLGTPVSDVYYLGLCLSAVTVTDMFAGLIMGRLLDRTDRVGVFLLGLNLFLVASSIMYLCASSPVWILASRLVAGTGNVATVALLTDVTRATTQAERTQVLIGFNVAQQLGLLFGPACNLFLREIDFSIGSYFHINKLNAPGLFMAVLYCLFEILVLFCYHDLYRAKKQNEQEDEATEATEEEIFVATWSGYVDEMLTTEIVALIFLRFIAMFGQTCLETIVTPMMMSYFSYGDFENSLLYLLGGVELVFVSIGIALISRKVSDRAFVLFGAALHIVTLSWFLAFTPNYKIGDRSNIPTFAVGTVLDLASVSIILDIGLSLLTKLVRDEMQGFATGVRRFFTNLALLLGPLWGGGALPWLNVLFALPLGMLLLATGLYLHSYSRMLPRRQDEPQAVVEDEETANSSAEPPRVDERTPLLN